MPLRLRKSLDQPYVVPADKRDLRWWLQQLATRRGALATIALVGVVVVLIVAANAGPFAANKLVPPIVTGIGDTGIRAPAPATPVVTPAPSARSTPPRAAGAAAAGWLVVSSRPWGSLHVDGRAFGTTPQASVSLPPGAHRVEIRRAGYETFVSNITIDANRGYRLTRIVLSPVTR